MFLFEIIDRRRFWTVLTAQERATGVFHHLAHHSWEFVYRFQVVWAGGVPSIFSNLSNPPTEVIPVTPGAPTDPALAALLRSPGPPFGRDIAVAAMRAAVLGGPPTRVDSPNRVSTNVPPNFFT